MNSNPIQLGTYCKAQLFIFLYLLSFCGHINSLVGFALMNEASDFSIRLLEMILGYWAKHQ